MCPSNKAYNINMRNFMYKLHRFFSSPPPSLLSTANQENGLQSWGLKLSKVIKYRRVPCKIPLNFLSNYHKTEVPQTHVI